MKILHVSTYENEGGAGRAAHRLHQALLEAGVDSHLYVQSRSTPDPRVHSALTKLGRGVDALRPTLDQLPIRLFHPFQVDNFFLAWFPDRLAGEIARLKPDLLHLHWVQKGHIRIETLGKLDQPLVWTFHDMWPMTGGCAHSEECLGFQNHCGACPQLRSPRQWDLSRWIWRRKRRAWGSKPIRIICPSAWMAGRARSSSLFAESEIAVVPNGLDLGRYRPVDREQARRWLGLPLDKKLVLFSVVKAAGNPYKGFQYFPQIFERLIQLGWADRVEFVALGSLSPEDFQAIPVPVHPLGRLSDDVALALAYGAVDVFVAPSRVDNLPNTVMEALACGTPVAAFAVGGIPEMVDHEQNGWLAVPGDVQGLAQGIDWILRDHERWQKMALQARTHAARDYDAAHLARRCIRIYQELLDERADRTRAA